MPTIKDVAREAGVSIATVSYVLNNKLDAVSEDTRREVWEAVERIGYRPNVTARNLRSSQSRLIGYAWHALPVGVMNPVLDHFTYYLAQAAEAAGYHLLTFTYPPDAPIPVYDELIRTRRVDAFVLASTTDYDPRIRFLLDKNFPFVSFGRSSPDWDFLWVDTDGQRGVYDAVRSMIELGHRRIGMVAWGEDSLTGNFRFQGYLDALHEAGITPPAHLIFRGHQNEQTGRDALRYFWSLPKDARPTALMSVTDLIAIGVIKEAEQMGVIIGKDLSLIGHDNLPLTEYLHPPLNTLEQPLAEVSQAVVKLLSQVLGKKPLEKRQILLPPKLILRESVAPPLKA